MTKRLVYAAVMAVLSACQLPEVMVGNGISVDTEIDVDAFDSISSRGSLGVIYTQEEGEPGATLTCDENLTEYYRIEVEDGTLVVATKNNVSIRTKVKSYITVHSPSLDGISVSGSGNSRITGPLASEGDIRFKVSGSGDIRAEGPVRCRAFSSSIYGSGRIVVAGVQADAARFKGSGSGSTRVSDFLTAGNVSATLSGSGGIHLVCKDAGDIDASISGSGSIHLSGNARSLNSHTTGSGRVDAKDLRLGQ